LRYNLNNWQRYTLMAEDAAESAGAKAPAITIFTLKSVRAKDYFFGDSQKNIDLECARSKRKERSACTRAQWLLFAQGIALHIDSPVFIPSARNNRCARVSCIPAS
jgi:hypothetical protein